MTNETLETIKNRRSCRAYKPEQITNEELDAVLEACSGSGASRAIGSASATAFWATLLQTPSPQHPASRIIS